MLNIKFVKIRLTLNFIYVNISANMDNPKSEKLKELMREAMRFAPGFRKNVLTPCPPPDSGARISPHQFHVLIILSKCGSISMSDLAGRLGVSNQQLTRIMDGLAAEGLVDRFTGAGDRRSVQAALTEKGRESLNEFEKRREDFMAGLLDNLSEEDIDACIFHIRALHDIFEKLSDFRR